VTNTPNDDLRVPEVLIADDDPGIVRFLADHCAKMGFVVRTASNGLQALVMAGRGPPDVLIVDVNMPELDGLSVCMRLLGPDKKSFQVIVISGGTELELGERCAGFGASYAHKGPYLWKHVQAALTGFFPDMPGAMVEEAASSKRGKDWKRPRVLVVDDDADIEAFLSSRLRKCGVDMLYAADGVKGFKIACKEEPSIILCDYFMPNGDAMYLLWKLRSTRSTAAIPFFVMSGRPMDKATEQSLMREMCGRPGALRIFTKPLDTQELFAAIQSHCAFDRRRIG
jgi:DNA-binding response OmpR family regulator